MSLLSLPKPHMVWILFPVINYLLSGDLSREYFCTLLLLELCLFSPQGKIVVSCKPILASEFITALRTPVTTLTPGSRQGTKSLSGSRGSLWVVLPLPPAKINSCLSVRGFKATGLQGKGATVPRAYSATGIQGHRATGLQIYRVTGSQGHGLTRVRESIMSFTPEPGNLLCCHDSPNQSSVVRRLCKHYS